MFYFFEVEDERFLERIYRFRYEIVCEELGFFDKNKYPDKLEYDEYDNYANQFVALDENMEIAATMRFIHHSPIGYPALKHLRLYPHFQALIEQYKKEKISEISRVFIHKKYRNFSDTRTIIKRFITEQTYFIAKEYGIEYGFAAIEGRFLRLLRKFNLNFEPVGEEQSGYGSPRFPCVLPTMRLERDNPHLVEKYYKRRWF